MDLTHLDPTTHDPERDRLESTWDRWQRLPLSYRINACLYVLAFVALVALLATVVSGSGSKPKQVEVASRAPSTTRPKPTTTTKAPLATVPTTAAAPKPSPVVPSGSSGASGAPAASSASSGGGGGGGGAQTPDTQPIPGFPTPANCQNSSNPECGAFRWEPDAGNNLPISIRVDRAPSVAGVGETVTFTVVVSDADHPVGDNCAVIDFGDGIVQNAPCQPLNCPPTFGPWTPPARVAGSSTFSYSHAYGAPGEYTPTFEFHTDRDRCPDPYGNFGHGTTTVTVSG